MKYYMIDFDYDWPSCGIIPDKESSLANRKADIKVNAAAKRLGINMLHAYSWPDGSLYKYIKTELSADEVRMALDSQLYDSGVSVNSITERSGDEDPYKAYSKTLKEYFDNAEAK